MSVTKFGLDVGFGNFKMVGEFGSMVVPSHTSIEVGSEYRVDGLNSSKRPLSIEVNGVKYFAGERAHEWGTAIENVDSNRLLGSPEAQVLMYATFTKYMKSIGVTEIGNAVVAVGLPLELSKTNEAKKNANKVKGWISGKHSWGVGGIEYRLSVDKVYVTSQASGIIQDYVLDIYGNLLGERKPIIKNEVGLISIGYRTIEIMLLNSMKINQSMTTGAMGGVREYLEMCNSEQMYTLGELDEKLKKGELKNSEKQIAWERAAIGRIEKVWGRRWQRFGRVIIVGGGAEIASQTISNYFGGKMYRPDEPVLAIARGLYKWATVKGGK